MNILQWIKKKPPTINTDTQTDPYNIKPHTKVSILLGHQLLFCYVCHEQEIELIVIIKLMIDYLHIRYMNEQF